MIEYFSQLLFTTLYIDICTQGYNGTKGTKLKAKTLQQDIDTAAVMYVSSTKTGPAKLLILQMLDVIINT